LKSEHNYFSHTAAAAADDDDAHLSGERAGKRDSGQAKKTKKKLPSFLLLLRKSEGRCA
jgi:hypothetical protein